MRSVRKPEPLIHATLFFLGLLCGFYYLQTVVPTNHIADIQRYFLSGEAESPFRYRILAPYLVNLISSPTNSTQVILAYGLFHAVGFGLMFISLYHWLKVFADRILALVGVLIVAVYIQLMLYLWDASLYSVFEIIFLCLALTTLAKKNQRWEITYLALIVVAGLNRETSILIPIVFALVYLDQHRTRWYWMRLLLFGGLWAGVFVLLRVVLGTAPDAITFRELLDLNTRDAWGTEQAILKNVFFLPIWIGTLVGLKSAPRFVQRIAIAGIPYLGLFLIYGAWNEVRLLLPLLTLLLPSFLSFIENKSSTVQVT